MQLIRDDILPFANSVPQEFIVKLMNILNRGSIHSATATSFIGQYRSKVNGWVTTDSYTQNET